MKKDKYDTYIELRKRFRSMQELGDVINKTGRTVFTKLTETGFTEREQVMILNYLGIEDNDLHRQIIFRR